MNKGTIFLLVAAFVVATAIPPYPNGLECRYCGRLTLEKRRECCSISPEFVECCKVAVPSDETYPGYAGGHYPGDYSGGPRPIDGGYGQYTPPGNYPGGYPGGQYSGGYPGRYPGGYPGGNPGGYPGGYPGRYPGYPGGYPNQGVYPPPSVIDPYGPADVILRKLNGTNTETEKDNTVELTTTTTESPEPYHDSREDDDY